MIGILEFYVTINYGEMSTVLCMRYIVLLHSTTAIDVLRERAKVSLSFIPHKVWGEFPGPSAVWGNFPGQARLLLAATAQCKSDCWDI